MWRGRRGCGGRRRAALPRASHARGLESTHRPRCRRRRRRGDVRRRRSRPFARQEFVGPSLRDGVRRAIVWLETAPPAGRELVVRSAFPLGSIDASDLTAVPADVGIRLERIGGLPAARTTALDRVFTSTGVVERDVTLASATTAVHERESDVAAAWPIEIAAAPADRSAVDAAVAAVRGRRVWTSAPERAARLVVLNEGGMAEAAAARSAGIAKAAPIHSAWMADAVARIARNVDVQTAAGRVAKGPAGLRFGAAPWQPIAYSAAGDPLIAAAAADNRLVVVSGARASDVVTPILLRALANALANVPDLQRSEIVATGDEDLHAWSRPVRPAAEMRLRNVDEDDRRWFWAAALLLLAAETWMRRSRPRDRRHEDEGRHVSPDEMTTIVAMIGSATRRARVLVAIEAIAWGSIAAALAFAIVRLAALGTAVEVVIVGLVAVAGGATAVGRRRHRIARPSVVRALERAHPDARNAIITADELTRGLLLASTATRDRVFAHAADVCRQPSADVVTAKRPAIAASVVAAALSACRRDGADAAGQRRRHCTHPIARASAAAAARSSSALRRYRDDSTAGIYRARGNDGQRPGAVADDRGQRADDLRCNTG